MPALTGISGLIAGFDTKAAVDELLGFRKFEISQLSKKQEAETAKQAALTELNTLISDFRDISIGMKDVDKFFSYTASLNSSDANVPASSLIDVAGDNSVTAGNHTMIVEQLASSERLSSGSAVKDLAGTAISSDATALNLTGSFTLNGTTINIASADSLKNIAANINNKATGVTASVIKVSDADFRLILAADDTGATGFTLTGTDLDVGGALENLQMGATGQANQFQSLQAAQDAQLTIDGLTISRSTNTISDALSGITFTLKQADPTVSVNMSIGTDTVDVEDQVQSFVDAYNAVFSYVNNQFSVDANGDNGILAGEAILSSIQGALTSSLLQSVSGLASDRDSLVKIGIEPDQAGKLSINQDRFANFLNNDTDAIRDLFVAQGSSNVAGLQFLVPGTHTTSGSYAVNLTTAASRANVTGTADLNVALLADTTVTITEAINERQAIVTLIAGSTQSQIISALNASFAEEKTENRVFDVALLEAGNPITGGTLFSNIDGVGVLLAGDQIAITGTTRTGVSVSNNFTILDPSQDTVSDLLSAIQSAFGQQVTAGIDATGRIQVTDNSTGDSQLALALTPDNAGGGSLAFGVDSNTIYTTEGRFSLGLEAVTSGNNVTIQHQAYGIASGFYISGASGLNGVGLGIDDITQANALLGTDIAGTINGETASGRGQVLVGNAGNADGIGLLYSGSLTGAIGDLTIGMGVAALFDGSLDLFSNPFSGFINNTITSSENTHTTLEERIFDLEVQMEKQRVTLTRSFARMESVMNLMNGVGNFLTQQIDAQNASN